MTREPFYVKQARALLRIPDYLDTKGENVGFTFDEMNTWIAMIEVAQEHVAGWESYEIDDDCDHMRGAEGSCARCEGT